MVVRMRHTKGHRNQRRAHHKVRQTKPTQCGHCGFLVQPHVICTNCGYYAGRQVIDVLAKLDKKERKKKEKELHQHEEEAAPQGKTLNPEELSRR
jgi:large subunit ribosomal protein L32